MRKFYSEYSIGQTLSDQLTWSHYLELIKISDKNETVVKYTLPEDNKTIFSSEFRLTIPSEKELISIIENEKRNNINLM